MEQPQYLIDTNAVIDYLGNKLPPQGMAFMNHVVDSIPIVSVITKIEVLGFNASRQYHNILSDFLNDAVVLSLTDAIVESSILLRRERKIKLPDVIIAATALSFNIQLITRNVRDFEQIEGLHIVNPWD